MHVPTSVKPILVLLALQFVCFSLLAQMRQVYIDSSNEDNDIQKLSFYSPSEGYIAFRDWIGYTTDSGRTFTRKPITLTNVNYNGYGVNLTFGFGINGVKAFDRNLLVVYGDYGLVPAILYSTNGGNSFTLVYHSQYSATQLRTGITDMVFPQNDNTGYAVDADRVLKTTNKGLTWTVALDRPASFFEHLEAVDNTNLIAFSRNFTFNTLIRTTDGGATWQWVGQPAGQVVNYAFFITPTKGWLSTRNNTDGGHTYYTTNGGATWTRKNDPAITPFTAHKMKFINDSVGFALTDGFLTYKTSDAGKTWEPVSRDNAYTYLGYSHYDLQVWSNDQLWAGGGHGFLELNTRAGDRPLPKAFFRIDTAGLYQAQEVQLRNFSKPYHSFKWLVNGALVSTSYSPSYTHDIYTKYDTVQLIVSDGVHADTAMQIQGFNAIPYPRPEVSSFTPGSGGPGTTVTISGNYFANVSSVSFGGIPAASYTVHSLTRITAVTGAGGNGNVDVTTTSGTGGLPGFIMVPPPVITSFAPLAAPIGATVTIDGRNFSAAPDSNIVRFGAVKARVLTASPTQLTVVVPTGATYKPVSITVNKHTAYSSQLFSSTFPSTCGFSEFTFAPKKTIGVLMGSNWGKGGMAISDLDGDGKPDMVMLNSQGVAIARNTGSPGNLAFAPVMDIVTGDHSGNVAVGDFDGDGRTDIAVTNNTLNTVSVLRNTTTGGVISFAPKVDLPTGGGPTSIAVDDLDGDGKPDMVVLNAGINVNTISVYRNRSLEGAIAFSAKTDYTAGLYSSRVLIGELDGDGKPDVIIVDGGILNSGIYSFSVYRNNSAMGSIAFDANKVFRHYTIPAKDGDLADVDGDGKLDMTIVYDITYTSGENNSIAVYRNTSTPGTVNFDTPVAFQGCRSDFLVTMGDLDGDGKADLYGACSFYRNVRLMKNTSTPGKVSLVSVNSPYILMSGYFRVNTIADMDGDGKPDLVSQEGDVAIYRNTLGEKGFYAGSDTTICLGRSVRLGFETPGGGQTYAWRSSPAGFSSAASNPVVSPTVSITYYVDVTDVLGCVFTDTVRVQVGNPAPPVNAGADRALCTGDSIQLGMTGDPAYTYAWRSTPAGFTSTLSNPVLIPPAGQNTYILSVNTGNCMVQDTVTIYVYNPPVANAGVDRTICSAFGTQIGTAGVYGVSYSWTSSPSGYNSAAANPNVYPANTTTYYLTATSWPSCTTRDTVIVTVQPSPPTPVISPAGTVTLCKGNTIVLSTTVNANNQWYLNGQAISGATGQSIEVSQAGFYSLRTSNTACTLSSTSVQVIVSDIPATPVIQASGGTAICGTGAGVVLTSSATYGNQWYKDSIAIAGATGQTYTATQQGSYTVMQTVAGCGALSAAVIVTLFSAPPQPAITANGPASFCNGGSVQLSSSASTGNQWYRDGVTIAGATSPTYNASVGGTYSVRVSQGLCTSYASNTVAVDVKANPPAPVITAVGNVLTASDTIGLQWYLNGVKINGATGRTYQAQVSGLYTVQTTLNGCSSMSTPYNFIAAGIVSPAAWSGDVSVYPNPVTEVLFITNTGRRTLLLHLYDAMGRLVYSGRITGALGTIDMKALATGTYHLQLKDLKKDETVSQTVVRQ